MENIFNVDDLVWAKMNKYPPWPGIIARPDARVKCMTTRKPQHYVYFFGTKNFAWVLDSNIYPHNDNLLLTSKSYKNPSKKFLSGIQEMEEAAMNFPSSPRSDDLDAPTSSKMDNFSRKRKVSEVLEGHSSDDEEQAVSSETGDTGIEPSAKTLNATLTTQQCEAAGITKELRVVLEDICKKPLEKNLKPTATSGEGKVTSKKLSTGTKEKKNVSKNFPPMPQREYITASTTSQKNDVCPKDGEKANILPEGNKSENKEELVSGKAMDVPISKKDSYTKDDKAPKKKNAVRATLEHIFKRKFEKRSNDVDSDGSDFELYCDTSSESDDEPDGDDQDEYLKTNDPYYIACIEQAKILKMNYRNLLENGPPQDMGRSESSTEDAPPRVHRRDFFERPKTPPLDLSGLDIPSFQDEDETIKIGFLGLGLMGRAIVKNLLISGFEVIVWNRTASKCEEFLQAGVVMCATPGDVALQCDIIFCCISDVECAMEIVAGDGSITQGLELCDTTEIENKGYVSLTSLDAATSQEIGNVITRFGMRYLEVPMIGTPELAEEGNLLLLASGDRFLFRDCEHIFQAFANDVLYISETVGHASQMRLIHNMFTGTMFASLGESMALLEKCDISEETFLHLLSMSEFNNPLLLEKSNSMAERVFATGTALRYQQEDLNSALEMATSCTNQSFVIAAAANEVFKRAMQRGYKNHDVSAVFLGAKY